tara:strand:- start:71 stop:526 length:456 start_codon:yes stop_codon:yes gene_type:complete
MYIQNQKLLDLLGPEVASMGFELLGIELVKNRYTSLLRVYIDNCEGVKIDDCVLVSQQITGLLDVNDPLDGKYNLEVSSPGLNRPLFTDEHLKKQIGQNVAIRFREKYKGKRKIVGIIQAVSDHDITIKCNDTNENIPLNLIFKANLEARF